MSAPTHKPIIDYFEFLNAASVHFQENSFFRMDLQEIFDSFRSGISFPAMAVESPEGDAEGSDITSSALTRTVAFSIYQLPQAGNAAQQNEMLDECERIGLKILARMRYDARQPGHLLYNRFKVSSAKWMKVGPLFTEQLYGYRFTVEIEGGESLKVDAADWKDIDLVC